MDMTTYTASFMNKFRIFWGTYTVLSPIGSDS